MMFLQQEMLFPGPQEAKTEAEGDHFQDSKFSKEMLEFLCFWNYAVPFYNAQLKKQTKKSLELQHTPDPWLRYLWGSRLTLQ